MPSPFGALWSVVMAEAETVLQANGISTPHRYGVRARSELKSPPACVWVPTRIRERNDLRSRVVEQVEPLFAFQEHCEIDCWGATPAQALALRWNVVNALHEVLRADLTLEDGSWVRPGEAWNQKGELFRLEVSCNSLIARGYITDLDTPLVPEPSTWTAESVETEIYKSPNVDTDGELLLTQTIT